MATADELNMLRQQMQETIAAQANAMQELQRQLNESQHRDWHNLKQQDQEMFLKFWPRKMHSCRD